MAPDRRRGSFAVFALIASVVWLIAVSGNAETGSPSALHVAGEVEFPRAELFIDTARGTRRFEVEVARTQAQRVRGLMFRTQLAANAGMLFAYPYDGEVIMWMKNSVVSLDMLFIDAGGRVVGIAANTTPLSEELISSGVPARAVLEVPAGTAARLGIARGDRVRSDALPAAR